MRSDRNPYFFLKKSKDSKVKEWLEKAENMGIEEIESLSLNPDLKKAMLFVATLGHQDRCTTTAELFADKMQAIQPKSNGPHLYDIFEYTGPDVFVKCVTGSHILINTGDMFIKDLQKVFIKHNWVNLMEASNSVINSYSRVSGEGTFDDLNKRIQLALNSKYH